MTPPSNKAGEKILVLCELDLELALSGARLSGEDVEDECSAINDAHPYVVLKVPLLPRCQFVVTDEQVVFEPVPELNDLTQFAFAKIMCY